jgi:hypothetical protein
MQNKIISQINVANTAATQNAYLDTAAELSKVNRKHHTQTDSEGYPLVYDMMVTVKPIFTYKYDGDATSPTAGTLLQENVDFDCKTVPNNWQTRNAVRMAMFQRDELREEAGVSDLSIGKYAKNIRFNMNPQMYGITYYPVVGGSSPSSSNNKRIYAYKTIVPSPGVFQGGVWDDGGVSRSTWDYTELTQMTKDPSTGVPTAADPFFLNVLGAHSSSTAGGPYDYISCLLAYNQRRQTVRDQATAKAGGDTQFIVSESPFFRIPEQDVSEDAYVQITLDEQDRPPYDRDASTSGIDDSMLAQPVASMNLSNTSGLTSHTFRVQAPLGLLQLTFDPNTQYGERAIDLEFEVLGTYRMGE